MKKRLLSMLIILSMIMSVMPALVVQAERYCPGDYEVLYSNFNTGGVSNGPTDDVTITVNTSQMIKVITTYHWNGGSGGSSGQITIYKDGTEDGSWTATSRDAAVYSNIYCDAYPDYIMEPGHTYKIVDSNRSTWSFNSMSSNCGFIELAGYETDGAIFKETGLLAMNISDAGAAQMDTYTGASNDTSSVMFRVASLEPLDWMDPLEYFFKSTGKTTTHELLLYGTKHVDPETLNISGVSAGKFTETVYCEGESALYCYSAPVSVPAQDCNLTIKVGDETLKSFSCTHIADNSPHTYLTEFYNDEYTENENGYISSFTVKLSGFSVPTDPSVYTIRRQIEEEPYYDDSFAQCTNVSEKDEYGRYTLTFELKENIEKENLIWLDFMIGENPGYYFGKGDCLEQNIDGTYYFTSYIGGYIVSIPSPYYALNGGNVAVKSPSFSVPKEATATPINISINPNSYEGGQLAYSTDGGATWSKWANISSTLSVELQNGNGEYDLVFKYKKDGLEEKQSSTYTVTLNVPDKDPEVIPFVTLQGTTTSRSIAAKVSCGSYAGGEMAWSVDGGKTFTEYKATAESENITLPESYGIYSVVFAFRKTGYNPYKTNAFEIDYNDGISAAPTLGGIVDKETEKEVQKKGDFYILSGDENSLYRLFATYPSEHTLEAVFKKADGITEVAKPLSYNKESARYEAEFTCKDLKDYTSVSLRVKAENGNPAGHELTLPIKYVEKAFIKALYAPTVSFEIEKDNEETYYAVAPGAVISGKFDSATGDGRTHQMTLLYVATNGESKSVTKSAESDKNNQFSSSITLPDDADHLTKISYELLYNTEVESSIEYDMSKYHIKANTSVKGIPEYYVKTSFTLKGTDVNKSVILTEDNIDNIELGDIPTGNYTYEISGTSGHIVGGSVSITRNTDITLSALPKLGSVLITTVGCKSYSYGTMLNPTAKAELSLKTPDGKDIKVNGISGARMEQIPIGSTGSVALTYDEATNEEIESISPAVQNIEVNGDETLSAAYTCFKYRTIKGYLSGTLTLPSGRKFSGCYITSASITITQEITRNGKKEKAVIVCPNFRYSSNLREFSIRCYDNVPAKLEIKSLTWNSETIMIEKSGNVNLGTIDLSDGGESIIEVKAMLETPASVNADGSNHFSTSDSVTSQVDTSFLNIYEVYTPNKGYLDSSNGDYEIYKENGHTYIKIKKGVLVGNDAICISAKGQTDFGNMTLFVDSKLQKVMTDESANPVITFVAKNLGGELRATVVDDAKSDMVGYLVIFETDKKCYFTKGKGEICLPYTIGGKAKVASFMVRESDVADMDEILKTNCQEMYSVLPNGNWQHDISYRLNDYDKKLPYNQVTLTQNRIIYIDDMKPTKPIGSEFLPPFSFDYHYELSENPNKVWMIGTLKKRYPEMKSKDKLQAIRIFIPDNNYWDSYIAEEELTASPSYYINGQEYPAGYTYWPKSDFTEASIASEIPLNSSNSTAFKVEWEVGALNAVNTADKARQTVFKCERIPMFTLINPGDIYIADQLEAQGLADATEEDQAKWQVSIPMRFYNREKDEENIIKIYDNGVLVKEFSTNQGRWGTGFTYGTYEKIPVQLNNNLSAGTHIIWAERVLDGETIQTEPMAFSLIEGKEHNEVYINELHWTHWNSRRGLDNTPDYMYFKNLSDIAGETIWVWPGKRHDMSFKVNNATSKELTHVYVKFKNTDFVLSNQLNDPFTTLTFPMETTVKKVECKLISENVNSNYSIWGFENVDLGYLSGFEFEFDYTPSVTNEIKSMDLDQRDAVERESFYQANGLGELPDIDELAESISSLNDAELLNTMEGMTPTYQTAKDFDYKVVKSTEKSIEMQLQTPTKEISESNISLKESGTADLPDIWLLMENERENGNQNPDEKGWDVFWYEYDTKQGSVLVRTASFEGEADDGRAAVLTHTSYYVPQPVTEKLYADNSKNGPVLSLLAAGDTNTVRLNSEKKRNVLIDDYSYKDEPAHWTKTVYDYSSYTYGGADTTFAGVKAAIWLDEKKYRDLGGVVTKETDIYKRLTTWENNNKFMKGANKTFQVLGVADAVITVASGRSGNDPSDLRSLLTYVKDDRARRSLELQVRDYEKMRNSIYAQDCSMSTISAASGFVPGFGFVGKLVTFIGGLGNSILSNYAKEANAQVYNTTLHDIRMQITNERRRVEYFNKLNAADDWMREQMDKIYGKNNWCEHTLREELKYWVLVTFPDGTVKYVWHEKVPQFSVYNDPSGYVFEGSEDNRIDGVTATLYYSDTIDGNYSVWKDPSKDQQQNPQYTNDDGKYSWMVPNGWWKVRYEKDGFLPAESNPMRVPPIHTAVNIGLLSTEKPKAIVNTNTNTATILFTKYMQLESLVRLFDDATYSDDRFDSSAFTTQFYDENGIAVPGTVSFPDKAANTGYVGSAYSHDIVDSDWFVRTAVFTPNDKTVDLSKATWIYADGMKSYSGIELDKDNVAENIYLITLNPNEGELSVPSLVTNDKGMLFQLPMPVRDNYTFDGWYTTQTGGTKVSTATVFDQNTTIFAHWTKKSNDNNSNQPVSHGSGNGTTTYTVTPVQVENGSVSVNPKNVSKGDTVTITVTPDKGFKLDKLTVTDQNGKEIILAEKDGKYTFVMPNGRVTVTPVFVKDDNTDEIKNPFVDVKSDDYFYDAVLWAVNEKITSGTTNITFSPFDVCTRAQAVTFLWRAAGSPEPTTTVNPFTDITVSDYFYKAVLWACENEITRGTSIGKFSPKDAVSRGQMVTFLYRAEEGKKVNEANPFADVSDYDYYYDSVLWAYRNSITNGTSDTTFSPDDNCLRGQIVTFLYRYYK